MGYHGGGKHVLSSVYCCSTHEHIIPLPLYILFPTSFNNGLPIEVKDWLQA